MHYILFSTPKTPKEHRNIQEPPSPLARFGEPALKLPSLRQWTEICSKVSSRHVSYTSSVPLTGSSQDWSDNAFASNSASGGTSSSGSTVNMSTESSSEELMDSFFVLSESVKDGLPRTPVLRSDKRIQRHIPPAIAKKNALKRRKRRDKPQIHGFNGTVAKTPL